MGSRVELAMCACLLCGSVLQAVDGVVDVRDEGDISDEEYQVSLDRIQSVITCFVPTFH